MRIDRTNEQTPKYMVNVYGWNVEDHYYYHYYKDAEKLVVELLRTPHEKGTIVSLYDIQKDLRKEFHKF